MRSSASMQEPLSISGLGAIRQAWPPVDVWPVRPAVSAYSWHLETHPLLRRRMGNRQHRLQVRIDRRMDKLEVTWRWRSACFRFVECHATPQRHRSPGCVTGSLIHNRPVRESVPSAGGCSRRFRQVLLAEQYYAAPPRPARVAVQRTATRSDVKRMCAPLADRLTAKVLSGRKDLPDTVLSGRKDLPNTVLSGRKDLPNAVLSGRKDLPNAVLSGRKDLPNAVLSGRKDLPNTVLSGRKDLLKQSSATRHQKTTPLSLSSTPPTRPQFRLFLQSEENARTHRVHCPALLSVARNNRSAASAMP